MPPILSVWRYVWENKNTGRAHKCVCVMCLCEWFSGGKDIANELQVAAEVKQTNTSSGSYYIIPNWSLGCSQTNTSEPRTSLKNACWRGRTVGSAGGGGGGEGWWGCDQGVIGEGNRQRCRREAAAGKTQTAAGGAQGSEAQPHQNGRQPGSVVDSESSVLS